MPIARNIYSTRVNRAFSHRIIGLSRARALYCRPLICDSRTILPGQFGKDIRLYCAGKLLNQGNLERYISSVLANYFDRV